MEAAGVPVAAGTPEARHPSIEEATKAAREDRLPRSW